MSFEPGTRVGPYEIVAPLGAGGMGEVYRARDTRLDRTVAIKVLAGALVADAESRRRFEHEARAIAALNDPHICTIHDVGHESEFDYLVLEYLEGQTLADLLRGSRRLPIEEALGIAIQIGDALDRAHRAGIVHHDLKPGNVMLVRRSAGAPSAPHVKLLDFGLATRMTAARPQLLDATIAVTMPPSLADTRSTPISTATAFGTVQYMAPEQLDGDPGDHRADIFAFGAVLYEMLAGRKAFEGSTAVTVIAAIMSSEPPSIAQLESTHPLLDRVMRRCLEKDRERRWQSIRDVTSELRWIAGQPAMPAVAAAAVPLRRRFSPWQWIAAGLTIVFALFVVLPLLLIAGLKLLSADNDPDDARPQALQLEITTPPTDDPSTALSPDGSQIAFIANRNRVPVLWIRSLDAIENRALAGTEGASFPFWSPDGRSIGFFAGNKLKRIDVAGGAPLIVTDAPNARGGAWNADGVILFAPGVNAPIMRVSTSGGSVEAVTQLNTGNGPAHRWPQFLPDGKRFLFSSTLGTAETNGVYIGSLDRTPPVRVLASEGAASRFAAPNMLMAIRQGALQAYSFDVATGAVQGEPTVIAQGFAVGAASGIFGVSRTGMLAYRAGTSQQRQLVWVDRRGAVLRAIGDPETDSIASPELSADGQSVLVFGQRTGDNDIWTIELARNLPHRITDGPPADAHPLWDPDGQHVVFTSQRFGKAGPARQAVNGGKAEPLFGNDESGQPLSWTRDRRYILLLRNTAAAGGDLVAVETGGQPREVVVARTQASETEGQFSPDGRWVALVSNDSGQSEVFIQSFPEANARTQISTAGGTQVRWSADGREIFYVDPDGKMMAVSVGLGGASPIVTSPVALFQTHLANGVNVLGNKPQYAVARDGRFLLNTAIESASPPIVVSVNWMRKLSK